MNYQKYQNNDYNIPTTVNQKSQNIKTTIRSAADATLTKGKKKLGKFWMNIEVIQSIEERRKYINDKITEGIQRYKQLRNRVNREVKKA